MQLLKDFIKNSKEQCEIKRSTEVKMLLYGYKHEEIMPILGVSSGFISTYKKAFFQNGVEGLYVFKDSGFVKQVDENRRGKQEFL